jgi:hypothetical protein
MKIGLLFVALVMMSSCYATDLKLLPYDTNNTIPPAIDTVVSDKDMACSKVYHSQGAWIIEQHCASADKQGIYISDSSGITHYNWFDEPFNKWAQNEGCNTKEDCYYLVSIDGQGKVTGFTYKFYINLSEGYYKVAIRGDKLIVIDKLITDHPS